MSTTRNILTPVVLIFVCSSCVWGQSIRTYNAQFTTNTIVADGIDSPGEWDGAETGGAGWNELRQPFGDADLSNNEFQILWDNDNLYLRWESDFAQWPNENSNPNPNIGFGMPNLNFYFDPNTIGEPNDVEDDQVKGYQFAFNLFTNSQGGTLISTNDNRNGVGFNTGAYFRGLFGNSANWGDGGNANTGAALQDIITGQNNQNSGPDAGGFAEVVFPWANFNADAQVNGKDTGLLHTEAPKPGEVWFLQVSVINSILANTNNLPTWNWTPSMFFASHGDLLAPNGHGELTFVGGDAGLLGDVNCDGLVNLLDVDPFVDLISTGEFSDKADINMDGVVNLLDVTPFIALLNGG